MEGPDPTLTAVLTDRRSWRRPPAEEISNAGRPERLSFGSFTIETLDIEKDPEGKLWRVRAPTKLEMPFGLSYEARQCRI
jgi:hypothetical protein